MANSRVKVPTNAKGGDNVEIRAMIMHPMENGYNVDTQGTTIPVLIVTEFVCTYDGAEVVRVQLQPGLSNLDVLRATFPAGTLSGAPKVRAMEIIDELELTKRGIYGGACGYLSFGGEMDVAIAIRTGVIKDGMLYVQAAAGIVADSVPEMEWQETENKARAVLRAAEQVQDGLDGEI